MEERTMIDIVCILFGLVMLYKMDTMVLYSTSPAWIDPKLVGSESAAPLWGGLPVLGDWLRQVNCSTIYHHHLTLACRLDRPLAVSVHAVSYRDRLLDRLRRIPKLQLWACRVISQESIALDGGQSRC